MSTICPDKNRLESFSRGTLGEEDSDLLIVHLQDCQSCQQELETIDGEGGEDTFIRELRGAAPDTEDDAHLEEPEFRSATAKALAALARMEELEPEFALPHTIGEYEIVKSIGRGGMGRVFLGRHTKLGRQVAIKVLAQHRRWDQRMHDRFEAEMRAIGGLNHPNIVVAHDARDVDGVAVLVTEYVEGLDGSDLLKRKGRLDIADASRIGSELCKALSYVAEKNLVHRDVKPSNVMIDDLGNVKLLDLGLARIQTVDGENEFTATGQAMGTADYVAPEQINDARNVDGRTDLYGLGCTLYKLIAGRAPFATDQYATPYAKMNAHVSQMPVRLSQLREDVPKEMEALVHQLLEKNPADRPSSAKEVQASLEKLANGSDLASMVQEARTLPLIQHRFENPTQEKLETKQKLQTRGSFWNRIPWWAAVASMLAAFGAGMLMQINLTVEKPDGSKANIVIPDGSTAVIDANGNITVKLAGGGEGVIERKNVTQQNAESARPEYLEGLFAKDNERWRLGNREWSAGIVVDEKTWGRFKTGDLVDLVTVPSIVHGEYSAEFVPSRVVASGRHVESTERDASGRPCIWLSMDMNSWKKREIVGGTIVQHDGTNVLKSDRYHLQGVWSGRLPNDAAFALAFVNNRAVFFGPGGIQKVASFDVEPTGKPGKARSLRIIGSKRDTALTNEWDRSEYWFEDSDSLRPDTLYVASSSLKGVITKMTRVKNAASEVELNATTFVDRLKSEPVRLSMHIAPSQPQNFQAKNDLNKLQYDPKPVITNRDFVAVRVSKEPRPTLKVSLHELAGEKLHFVTRSRVGSRLVVKYDGEVIMAPIINSPISSEAQIEGDFTEEQLREISKDLVPMSRIDRRKESEHNLHKLAMGLFNYESAYLKFPASKHRMKDWKHPFSWRVAILPYINQQKLFDQFRFDQPWDSEHNMKLAKKMPDVFRLPGDEAGSFRTHYLAVSSERTIIATDKPSGFGQITDGSSNTIMLIQDEEKVVWTQPDDFEVTDESIAELVTRSDPFFTFVIGDGSVNTIPRSRIMAAMLKSMLLRDDGTVVDYELLGGSSDPFDHSDVEFADPIMIKGPLSEAEDKAMQIQEGLPVDVPEAIEKVKPPLDMIDVPLQNQRR